MADEESFESELYHYTRILVGIVGGIMASVLKRLTHFIATTIQDDIDWKVKYSVLLNFSIDRNIAQRVFCSQISEREEDGTWDYTHYLCHQSERQPIGSQ